jgi:hypothetical protein
MSPEMTILGTGLTVVALRGSVSAISHREAKFHDGRPCPAARSSVCILSPERSKNRGGTVISNGAKTEFESISSGRNE